MKPAAHSRPTTPIASHYIRDLMDAPTLAAVVSLFCRTSGADFAYATAVVLSAEEIVVFHGPNGTVEGAHGFRYADVRDGFKTIRLIHSVFSTVNPSAAGRRVQFNKVVQRSYEREHLQARSRQIVWAFSGECDPELMLCATRAHPMRAVRPEDLAVPAEELAFYTDRFTADAEHCPASVVDAVFRVLKEQEVLESNARGNRWSVATYPANDADLMARAA